MTDAQLETIYKQAAEQGDHIEGLRSVLNYGYAAGKGVTVSQYTKDNTSSVTAPSTVQKFKGK